MKLVIQLPQIGESTQYEKMAVGKDLIETRMLCPLREIASILLLGEKQQNVATLNVWFYSTGPNEKYLFSTITINF